MFTICYELQSNHGRFLRINVENAFQMHSYIILVIEQYLKCTVNSIPINVAYFIPKGLLEFSKSPWP